MEPAACSRSNLQRLLAPKEEVAALAQVQRLFADAQAGASHAAPGRQPPSVLCGLVVRVKYARIYHLLPVEGLVAAADGTPRLAVAPPTDTSPAAVLRVPVSSVSGTNPLEGQHWETSGQVEAARLTELLRQRDRPLLLREVAAAAWRKQAALAWHAQHGDEPPAEQQRHLPALLQQLQDDAAIMHMQQQLDAERVCGEPPALPPQLPQPLREQPSAAAQPVPTLPAGQHTADAAGTADVELWLQQTRLEQAERQQAWQQLAPSQQQMLEQGQAERPAHPAAAQPAPSQLADAPPAAVGAAPASSGSANRGAAVGDARAASLPSAAAPAFEAAAASLAGLEGQLAALPANAQPAADAAPAVGAAPSNGRIEDAMADIQRQLRELRELLAGQAPQQTQQQPAQQAQQQQQQEQSQQQQPARQAQQQAQEQALGQTAASGSSAAPPDLHQPAVALDSARDQQQSRMPQPQQRPAAQFETPAKGQEDSRWKCRSRSRSRSRPGSKDGSRSSKGGSRRRGSEPSRHGSDSGRHTGEERGRRRSRSASPPQQRHRAPAGSAEAALACIPGQDYLQGSRERRQLVGCQVFVTGLPATSRGPERDKMKNRLAALAQRAGGTVVELEIKSGGAQGDMARITLKTAQQAAAVIESLQGQEMCGRRLFLRPTKTEVEALCRQFPALAQQLQSAKEAAAGEPDVAPPRQLSTAPPRNGSSQAPTVAPLLPPRVASQAAGPLLPPGFGSTAERERSAEVRRISPAGSQRSPGPPLAGKPPSERSRSPNRRPPPGRGQKRSHTRSPSSTRGPSKRSRQQAGAAELPNRSSGLQLAGRQVEQQRQQQQAQQQQATGQQQESEDVEEGELPERLPAAMDDHSKRSTKPSAGAASAAAHQAQQVQQAQHVHHQQQQALAPVLLRENGSEVWKLTGRRVYITYLPPTQGQDRHVLLLKLLALLEQAGGTVLEGRIFDGGRAGDLFRGTLASATQAAAVIGRLQKAKFAGRKLRLRPDWNEVDAVKAKDPEQAAAAEHRRAAQEAADRPSR